MVALSRASPALVICSTVFGTYLLRPTVVQQAQEVVVGGVADTPQHAVTPCRRPDRLLWSLVVLVRARQVLVGGREADRALVEAGEAPPSGALIIQLLPRNDKQR